MRVILHSDGTRRPILAAIHIAYGAPRVKLTKRWSGDLVPWIIYDELGWRWGRLDAQADMLAESSRGFPTRQECIADAEKFGFSGEFIGSYEPDC